MAATVVTSDLYTKKVKVFELTVKDKLGGTVDLSSIVSPSDDIHFVMQRAKNDTTDAIYKSLGGGIEYKTDGIDGVVLITITLATDIPLLDASAGDLTYFGQLSVELSNQPAITAEMTLTIKHALQKVIHIDIELPGAADSGSAVIAGTLQTDENLEAPSAADSGSVVDAGVITTTVGV